MAAIDEDSARILNCTSNCWPEHSFTYNDLKKPTGDKFREILMLFLKGILTSNYQLSSVNMQNFSRNPEMYAHMESTIALYKDLNKLLKSMNFHGLHYTDLIRPTPNVVKEVLLTLTNFVAYFESEESRKEEIEEEVEKMRSVAIENEKKLVEEERYLAKCKQSDEEKKIKGAELREVLLQQKENYHIVEKSVSKLEAEFEDANKRIRNLNQRIEEGYSNLKQLEKEKEKAAETVVPDPDALEAELTKSRNDKETMETSLASLKSRLPILEQQIADRTSQLQERKETHQRLAQVKTRESKIKAELQKAENECCQVDEEKTALANQLKKDTNLIDSKKRMLEDYNHKLEQLRGSLEKARSDLKQCASEEDFRKAQQQSRLHALNNEIAQLKQDIELINRALEEGAAVFEDVNAKHQRDVQQIYSRWEGHFIEVQNLLNVTFPG